MLHLLIQHICLIYYDIHTMIYNVYVYYILYINHLLDGLMKATFVVEIWLLKLIPQADVA